MMRNLLPHNCNLLTDLQCQSLSMPASYSLAHALHVGSIIANMPNLTPKLFQVSLDLFKYPTTK